MEIKHLGINIMKYARPILRNYQTIWREIQEDQNKWSDIPCSWLGRLHIVRKLIPPKLVYRLNAFQITIPMICDYVCAFKLSNCYKTSIEIQRSKNDHDNLEEGE